MLVSLVTRFRSQSFDKVKGAHHKKNKIKKNCIFGALYTANFWQQQTQQGQLPEQ